MKIDRENAPPVIIGKRITLGAAIMALSEVAQFYLPDHATPIGLLSIPLIFVAQLIVVNKWGVTT